MQYFRLIFFFFLLLAFAPRVWGQTAPVAVQAESGYRGADFRVVEAEGIQFVTVQNTGAGQNPGTADRLISYTVTFPGAGLYDLYARLRVGADAANDDSFFYGNGFGTKSPTNDADWITANNLHTGGFTEASAVVQAGGAAGSGVWKWMKLSAVDGGEAPIQFTVPAGALTQTFQIGAREDGLDLDRFAFGLATQTFTVATLNGDQTGGNPPPPPAVSPIAQGQPKFLGNIYSTSQLPNFTQYWNQVAPENGGKWGSVESTRNQMNWTQLDAAYQLAKDNGLPFRFHVLIWGNQQPAWMETLPPAQQLAEIREWFAAVAARYPAIDMLEVVNEPINDPPSQAGNGGGNYLNALGGTGTTGWDWVITSFQLAREYFPNTELMLNEYSVTNSQTNAQRYITLINLLKSRDLIDAVGVQGHAFETRVTAATTKANLDLIAATGLPIYITEMDIDDRIPNGTPSDQVQLQEYQRIFSVFWEHPAVRGITLWGYRPGMWRTDQGAFLITADGTERPALVWLRQYVSGIATGVSKPQEYRFVLYPNPVANGRLHIEGIAPNTRLRVLDATGRLLQEVAGLHQASYELELNISPGLYLIQLSDGQRASFRRIVVQ